MLDHHLQRAIVYKLAFSPSLRFSELKPDTIDNKLFSYHLHKVITAGYVEKGEDGTYTLTPEGRRLGVKVLDKQQAFVDQADSVLFLAVRRKSDDAWLLYRRKTHPLLDRTGFMHGLPIASDRCEAVAHQTCLEKTGISGEFKVLGGGYFRVYDKENLESFTHFTLLAADDARGELVQNDEFAEYYWDTDPDFSAADMLPNMTTLAELYTSGKQFFIEKTFQL